MLTLLDDEDTGSPFADFTSRNNKIRFPRQLAGLRVVDHKAVHSGQ